MKHPLLNVRGDVSEGVVTVRAFFHDDPYHELLNGTPQTVVLYRRKTGFVFGRNRMEFFDGLLPAPEDELLRVSVSGPGRKVELRDPTAVVGETYCYWIGTDAADNIPTGPIAVKIRHPEVWWPHEKVQSALGRLECSHPGLVQCSVAGTTRMGKEIPAIRVGTGPVAIALVGLIHAGEAGTELIFPILEQFLEHDRELLARASLLALPVVNVDERERMAKGYPAYLRVNASGVDLNRNFPAQWDEVSDMYGLDSSDPDSITYRGPGAASEPETQAVINTFRKHPPRATFSFHCLASICSPRFLAPAAAEGDARYHEESLRIAQAYWRGYYGKATDGTIYYRCSEGSLPTWLYQEYGTPAFDLEWDNDESTRPCLTDETTPALITETAQRHYQGLREVLLLLHAN